MSNSSLWIEADNESQPVRNLMYARVDMGNNRFVYAPLAANLNADGLATLSSGDASAATAGFPSTTVKGIQGVPSGYPVSVTVTNPSAAQSSVAISNFPTSFNIGNLPSVQPVSGTVNIGNYPANQLISGSVSLTGTPSVSVSNFPAFPATQVVSGSVSVSNFPSNQAVTGTFWQATQPVSLASLPTITGSVSVTNFPSTQNVAFASAPTVNIGTMPSITGSVSITGTPTVTATISGTPTVNVGTLPAITGSVNATIVGTPNVAVTNTPTVSVNNFPSQATVQSVDYLSATSGTMFMAGSGNQAIALLSNFRMLISNPTASGKVMYIREMDIFSTVSLSSIHMWINPTVVPTTVRPVTNANIVASGNPSAVGVVKADNNATALSGGTDSGLDYGAGANAFETILLGPLVLHPGQSIGLNAYAVAAVNLTVLFRWTELTGT